MPSPPPAKVCHFHAELAETVGIHAALLLQAMHESGGGTHSLDTLCAHLPQSTPPARWLQTAEHLVTLSVLAPWQQPTVTLRLQEGMAAKVSQLCAAVQVRRKGVPETTWVAPPPSKAPMTPDWQPGAEWCRMLKARGCADAFVRDILPSFRQYWIDRGQHRPSWGHCFFTWTLSQWEMRRTPLPSNWQPNAQLRAYLCETTGCSNRQIDQWVQGFRIAFAKHQSKNWTDEFLRFAGARRLVRHAQDTQHLSEATLAVLAQEHGIDGEFARTQARNLVAARRATHEPAPTETELVRAIQQQWHAKTAPSTPAFGENNAQIAALDVQGYLSNTSTK